MNISRKLILSFSMASFLVALVGYIDHQILKQTENKVDVIIDDIYPIINGLQDIRHYSQASLSSATETLLHTTMANSMPLEEHEKTHQLNKDNNLKNITLLRKATNNHLKLIQNNFPGEIERYEKIAEAAQKIEILTNKIIALDQDNATGDKIALFHQQLIQLNNEISSNIKAAIEKEQNELAEHHDYTEELLAHSLQKSIIITSIAIASLLLLWGFVNKKISRPLISLRNATIDISKGSFDTRVAINSNDEIYRKY